jgi:hypothetical protein
MNRAPDDALDATVAGRTPAHDACGAIADASSEPGVHGDQERDDVTSEL